MNFFTRQRLTNLGILIVVLLNITTLALFWFNSKPASPDTGKNIPAGGQVVERFLTEVLHFTPEQEQQFQLLKQEHQQQTRKIREEIRPLKDKFFSHLDENYPDDTETDSLAAEIGKKNARLDLITLEHFRKIRKLCNDKQKTEFDKLIQEVLRTMAQPPHERNEPPPGRN